MISNGILEYDDNINSISAVNLDNMSEYGEQVSMLVKMFYSIVNGNSTEYNSYFSEKYFTQKQPKEDFTMQKLYNGRLTYVGSEDVKKDGKTYTEYTYTLKYMIYENNGTFRKDIGDSTYRIQYIINKASKIKLVNIKLTVTTRLIVKSVV